jgi:hypothetical protein
MNKNLEILKLYVCAHVFFETATLTILLCSLLNATLKFYINIH